MSSKETNCKTCSKPISDLAYKCNYCGSTFCQDHRIPENHDCVGLELVIRNEEQWGLGLLDVDSEPSKDLGVEKAAQLIEEKRSIEKEQETGPSDSSNTEGLDSTSDYMDPEIKEKAKEVVELLDNSAPDIDEYKDNPESAYDTVEPMVYSSAVEPEYNSSPDVSIDGSVKEQNNNSDKIVSERQKPSSITKLIPKRLLVYFVLCVIAGFGYYVLYL